MKLELLRISLLDGKQHDAFERKNEDGSRMTREEWLWAVFSEKIDFIHRGSQRYYVPSSKLSRTDRIVGKIGRQIESKENEPPELGLEDITRPVWKASIVIIDPVHHDDGQKVAIEERSAIGNGSSNFASLCAHLNNREKKEPYIIEARNIISSQSFWDYADGHRGNVTSVTLDVLVPNMFGGEGSFENDARRLREREKARRIKETIENEDGLNVHTDRMKEAVDYVSRGGGKIKARAKSGLRYNSERSKLIIEIEEPQKSFDAQAQAAMKALVPE